MSAIFGLLRRGGQPVSRPEILAMADPLSDLGPDGGGTWIGDNVALGQHLMCFTVEDRFERQPTVWADGRCALVFAGRLDNRCELTTQLGLPHEVVSQTPDSAFVLSAYRRWGAACVDQLVGALTFAVWDGLERRMLVVRSAGAAPPLFYTSSDTLFAFSTMPRGLFALPSIVRELDLERVADYLTGIPAQPGSTLYRDIHLLESGHLILVDSKILRRRRYRTLDVPVLQLNRDDDYVEAFAVLWDRVVADHVRSASPVGVFMSGGLDSTSVAATAALHLREARGRITAFIEVPRAGFDGDVPPRYRASELTAAQAMARLHANLYVEPIRTDGRLFLDNLEIFFGVAEVPFRNAANRVWWEEILRDARSRGIGVLLTGGVGNLTMSWDGRALIPQLIRGREWRRALHELRSGVRTPSLRVYGSLAKELLSSILPTSLWLALRRLRSADDGEERVPIWRVASPIHPAFAAEQRVDERGRAYADFFRGPRAASAHWRQQMLTQADEATKIAIGYRVLFGTDTRDPTADSRLIEFCFAVPEDQYRRNGTSRWLIRRAMSGRLPSEVLTNEFRGLQAADSLERIRARRSEILDELSRLHRCELARTVVDLERLRRAVVDLPETGDGRLHGSSRPLIVRGLMMARFLEWFCSSRTCLGSTHTGAV